MTTDPPPTRTPPGVDPVVFMPHEAGRVTISIPEAKDPDTEKVSHTEPEQLHPGDQIRIHLNGDLCDLAGCTLAHVDETLYRRQCADGAACNDGLSAPYPHTAACFVDVSDEDSDA